LTVPVYQPDHDDEDDDDVLEYDLADEHPTVARMENPTKQMRRRRRRNWYP